MATSVLRSCLQADKLAEVKKETIAFSQSALLKWLRKRDGSQIKGLQAEFGKPLQLDTAIHYFKLMVKRDAKVKLDSTCLTKHPPAQNIMFHAKAVNALFSPLFDEFKNRFMYCLKPHIIFFTEMDNRTFASVARGVLGPHAQELCVGEVDFSKFDKSQDIFIKEFERCVYSQLGFDAELLNLWMQGEYHAKATTMDHQLSFSVECQRRSGAANTWIGNSVVTLGILSMYYRLENMQGVFISGDDSLLFSRQAISNHSEAICLETGFEAKFMSPSVPYFCSKFLVFCEHKYFFVPDPYKIIVKLGQARSEVSDIDLFEIFTSFKDLTKDMHDERVLEYLARLVECKYNLKSRNVLSALHAVHCLSSNFASFKRLFPKQSGWFVADRLSKILNFQVNSGIVESQKFLTAYGEKFFLSYSDDST